MPKQYEYNKLYMKMTHCLGGFFVWSFFIWGRGLVFRVWLLVFGLWLFGYAE